MEMMYKIIADELKAMGIKDMHPQDYLNFFCLGNREESSSNGSSDSEKSTDKSAAVMYYCIFSSRSSNKKMFKLRTKNIYPISFHVSNIYSCIY
jgi:hypothetical protein